MSTQKNIILKNIEHITGFISGTVVQFCAMHNFKPSFKDLKIEKLAQSALLFGFGSFVYDNLNPFGSKEQNVAGTVEKEAELDV
jgi:hypothetical protein